MRFAAASMLVATLALAGCGKTATTPTDTSPIISTELYAGTLSTNGSGFYSFTVTVEGTVKVTLASLAVNAGGPPIATVIGIGLGIPTGTGCSLMTQLNVAPGLVAQLTKDLIPSIYCVKIFDVGNLSGAVNFAVRIAHP